MIQLEEGCFQPQLRISFKNSIAMGPGKVCLLSAIEETGSISGSARKLGMSYRRAWVLVATMNQSFREPVVKTLTGGSRGGGAEVTEFGKEIIRRYLRMAKKAKESVREDMEAFATLLA